MIDFSKGEIQFEVELALSNEGIVITKYLKMPMLGFSLRGDSTLYGHSLKSLTGVKGAHPDGSHRQDLVGFCLANKKDVKKFAVGEIVWLENIEIVGVFD